MGIVVTFNSFATIYQRNNNGVENFSNIQTSGSTEMDLSNHPINVLSNQNETKVSKTSHGNMALKHSQQNASENTL